MDTVQVRVSQPVYDRLAERARQANRSPDDLADELLRRQLEAAHPQIEIRPTRSGPEAVIRDTRVPVSLVVGYARLGMTAEEIASEEALPALSVEQVQAALAYYHDHPEEIAQDVHERTAEGGRALLRRRMQSKEDFLRITGTTG